MVDDTEYQLIGFANMPNVSIATVQQVDFTATRTSFLLTAGPMTINASYISPIEVCTLLSSNHTMPYTYNVLQPTDLLRQSMPFTYFALSATSNDGNAHNLRVYSDITGGSSKCLILHPS